jgi:IS5 family transposase
MNERNIRRTETPGLFDYENRLALLARHEDPLARLDAVVDWSLFLPLVEAVRTPDAPKGPGGRPAWPTLVLLKMLVLQRLYQLSDEAAEYQLLDRLSFQRFVGLSLADKAPDQNTLRLFREAINARGLEQRLFDTFVGHLAEKGLLPRNGCIVDATFVEVPRQRNGRSENAAIKEGRTPESWEGDAKKRAHKDVDARWTKKNEEVFYGYKDHVKVKAASKLIEKAVVTAASVHDSRALEALVEAGDEAVFADSAYAGAELGEAMEAKGVARCVVQPARKNAPLTAQEEKTNREISRVRSRVEHVFALMSGQAGRIFQRYVGMQRNAGAVIIMNWVYNLQRYEQIVRLGIKVA